MQSPKLRQFVGLGGAGLVLSLHSQFTARLSQSFAGDLFGLFLAILAANFVYWLIAGHSLWGDYVTEKPNQAVAHGEGDFRFRNVDQRQAQIETTTSHDALHDVTQPTSRDLDEKQKKADRTVESEGLTGVGGWLTFFCVDLTMLIPLSSTLYMIKSWTVAQPAFEEFPSLRAIVIVENSALLALLIYGVVVGCSIWSGNPRGRSLGQQYLLIRLVSFVTVEFAIGILVLKTMPADVASAVGGDLLWVLAREVGFFLAWSLYFRVSKRVRNTYRDEEADDAKTDGVGGTLSSSLDNVPGDPTPVASAEGKLWLVNEQHVTVLPVSNYVANSNAEWHMIHGGQEIGPLTLAELIDTAAASEVAPEDLVKQTGGLWTKASDFHFLQPFLTRHPSNGRHATKKKALDDLSGFHGIWLSKKALAIGSAGLVALAIVWIVARRISEPRPPMTGHVAAAPRVPPQHKRLEISATGTWSLQRGRANDTLELTDREGIITGVIRWDSKWGGNVFNVHGSRIGSSIELNYSTVTLRDFKSTTDYSFKGTLEENRILGTCIVHTTSFFRSGDVLSGSNDMQWIAFRR